ncbi:Hypothetical predicted protein [Pelobates cultripes]|uniref:Uncharacterized protein n=1 Tax=Pelobates cultripes TaxID=61616 RepID=A0AAD1WGY4_PELCU|nr:Hypothetical predicted protein [Pelobates cultripes]
MEKSTNHNISQLQYSVIKLLPLPLSLLLASQCRKGFFKPCRFQSAGRGPFSASLQPRTPFPRAAAAISRHYLPPAYQRRLFFDADLSRPFYGGDLAAAILSLSSNGQRLLHCGVQIFTIILVDTDLINSLWKALPTQDHFITIWVNPFP